MSEGSITILQLMKLLYLADRRKIEEVGSSITGDRYVSMRRGPVLSRTYDLMKDEGDPGDLKHWHVFISGKRGWWISNTKSPDLNVLSETERRILYTTFSSFGDMSASELVNLTHSFPEWRDPGGSSCEIGMNEILESLFDHDEVELRRSEEQAVEMAKSLFGEVELRRSEEQAVEMAKSLFG